MTGRPRRFTGRAPADIDAVRWLGEGDPDGASVADIKAWGAEWKRVGCRCLSRPEHPSPHFIAVWDQTVKDWAHVRPGGWVVRRLDGTFTAVSVEHYQPATAQQESPPFAPDLAVEADPHLDPTMYPR